MSAIKSVIERCASDKELQFAGYDLKIKDGHLRVERGRPVKIVPGQDYGSDPIFDDHGKPTGYVRLVPSGKIIHQKDMKKALG